MAPIKFDEQFKNELEKRRIEPSKMAWNRLEERLDGEEQAPRKKGYWWLGLAASFVGLLLIVSFLIKKEDTSLTEPVIVDTTEEMPLEDVTPDNEVQEDLTSEIAIEEVAIESEQIEMKETPLEKQIIKEKTQILQQANVEEVIAENSQPELEQELIEEKTKEVKSSIDEQKAQEVVARIKALENANASVSEQEIEALLMEAQKELSFEKAINEATNTVDADALLKGVEEDLEESFRARVFKLLRTGYEDVKTAVAERNN